MLTDNFDKYEKMRDEGYDAQKVYLTAKKDNLDTLSCIRMLRSAYNLSLIEAKEVVVIADKLGASLEDYQETLIPGLSAMLEDLEDDEQKP